MPEFMVTSPKGERFKITAPEGTTEDQALAHFREQMQGDGPKATTARGVKKPVNTGSLNSAADFFKSIPQGVVRGATSAASALGQAEEGLATGGAKQTVPGAEESAKLAGVDRLPQPQGMAGRFGGALGEAIGNPTSYLGPPGGRALAMLGAALGGQAGAETGIPGASFVGGMAGGAAAAKAPTLARTAGRGMFPMGEQNAVRDAAAKTLESLGVKPTAGDITGSPALREAERMGAQPAKMLAEKQLTEKAADFMGERADRIGPEVMNRARDRIKADFERSTKALTIRENPELFQKATELRNQAANILGEENYKKVAKLIDDIMPQERGERWFINKATGQLEMKGESYAELTKYKSELGRAMRDANPDVAHYAKQVRQLIDKALEKSVRSPGEQQAFAALKKARSQYRARLILQDSLADPKEAARLGRVDPAKFYAAVEKHGGDPMASDNDMDKLAYAARSIMSPMKEASAFSGAHEAGSARGMARHAGAAAGATMVGGAAGFALGGGPVGGAIGSAAGLAAGIAAPRAVGAVVNHPRVQSYLKNRDRIDAAREAKAARASAGERLARATQRGMVGKSAAQEKRKRGAIYQGE